MNDKHDMLPELVIYHSNCDDGFCSAWLHWRHSPRKGTYFPAQYQEEFPWHLLTGADYHDSVLILDFSYPRDVLERVAVACGTAGGTLLVLDHHKTAAEHLDGFPHAIFDMNKSGARLTLEHLMPDACAMGDNWLVDYVEDRDLWRKELPMNREIRAALQSYPYDFEEWEAVYERGGRRLAQEGRSTVHFMDRIINMATAEKNFGWVRIAGHVVPAVNNTAVSVTSDIVGKLAEEHPDAPFAAGFFVTPGGRVVYNLRSRGDFDVGALAKELGGGGHPPAAGFKAGGLLDLHRTREDAER